MSDLFSAPPAASPAPPPPPAPPLLRGRMVDLCDGTQVDSWSEAWRMECFARHMLSLERGPRSQWMADLVGRYGEEGIAPLRAAIARLVGTRSGGSKRRE